MAAERVTPLRGPYLGDNRVIELERRITTVEATLTERIRQLQAELDAVRNAHVAALRAQASLVLDLLQQLQPRSEKPTG